MIVLAFLLNLGMFMFAIFNGINSVSSPIFHYIWAILFMILTFLCLFIMFSKDEWR